MEWAKITTSHLLACFNKMLNVPFPNCKFMHCEMFKGKLLFKSVKLVEDVVPNLICGRWLCYLNTMHHICKKNVDLRVYLDLYLSDFQKCFFCLLVLFYTKRPNIKSGSWLSFWVKWAIFGSIEFWWYIFICMCQIKKQVT